MADEKTAFVFAGGGSLGAVQVGMLQVLLEAGLRPDFIVGSSVGALNAGFFAGDPTPDGVERLAEIWRSLRRRDIFPPPSVRRSNGSAPPKRCATPRACDA